MHRGALESTWHPAGGKRVDQIESALALGGPPVYVETPEPATVYGGVEGRKPPRKAHRGPVQTAQQLTRVVLAVLVPPLVFTYVATLLCFGYHFRHPMTVWFLAALGLVPAAASAVFAQRAKQGGSLLALWFTLSTSLFLMAFALAAVLGELNYWHFGYPFFFLESMKTYINIDPAEMNGVRMMDAGKVYFAEGARVATDLAMSFTSGDTYCVAPITTSVGLPSQNARGMLSSYDLWAVGINCCKSSQADFHCGEYANPAARAGLRAVSDERRDGFRLAVQQAEALYDIHATHPVFFYWVEDPVEHESAFFGQGFSNWVSAQLLHFVLNAACVCAFLVLFGLAPRHGTDLSVLEEVHY